MGSYNNALVVLSVVVAALASYTALDLASRISASRAWAERAWLTGGACSMGIGIWSMHFIGMLAFNSPVPLGYDVATTVLSLLIAIVASAFALYVASRERITWQRLAAAGSVMGTAIVAMHYVGMAAIVLDPPLTHAPSYVVASVAVAIGASIAALALAFKLQRPSTSSALVRPLSALLMGGAIAGMHYTAMAGLHIANGAVCLSGAVTDKFWLAGAVATATVVILCATLVLSLMDAHLAARTRQMRASLEHAEESNKAKDDFLAMLGHELRNPLAAVSNAVALLDSSGTRSSTDEFALGVMRRQVTHLRRMIDDLVDVGRVTAGKIALQLRPIDLYAAACNAVATLNASGRAIQHSVECTGKPVWINGDSTRIEQIISNLLTNAVTYSPPGSSIQVTVGMSDGEAMLAVRDNGIGLSADELPRVFELFYQAQRPCGADRGNTGLGIGLTLVRKLVDLHGGRVEIDSPGVGRGTTVTIRMPAVDAHARAPAAVFRIQRRDVRRIVVIDDERDIRETLRILLSRSGYAVFTADDGDTGLQCIRSEKPHVAFVDIGMPRMSGYEVARQVRAARLDVFLVALTGYGQAHDIARAREAGFDTHATKPVDLQQLNDLVAAAADRARAGARAANVR